MNVKPVKDRIDPQTISIQGQQLVSQKLSGIPERLWHKDPTLWKTDIASLKQISNSLGWLQVAQKMQHQVKEINKFVAEVKNAGFLQVLLIGMGGSSMAPLVFQRTFTPRKDYPRLIVLDTTDPVTILRIEQTIPLERTLFIVSSKSGTTAEPLALLKYFYAKVEAQKKERAGENYIAITDPGTSLETIAKALNFRHVFLNFPDIGGRYSALSYVGLLPAALMGIDITKLLEQAILMMDACQPSVKAQDNPGITLGAEIGYLAKQGKDKMTLLTSAPVASFGMWLEQLIAESTGKDGTGILPVVGETLGDLSVYSQDHFFVYLPLFNHRQALMEQNLVSIREAGYPLITIQLGDLLDIGQEFFRWELAVATTGIILNINPFDQPNVQESKDSTNRILGEFQKTQRLPEENAVIIEKPLYFYGDGKHKNGKHMLRAFLSQVRPGDYIALQAYFTETPAIERDLQTIRNYLRDMLHVATTSGYGPRFLHSTGQYHKGGPNTGLFIQLTADDIEDIPVPDSNYTFSILKQAQAMGDLQALRNHNRRVLRIHLGTGNILDGLLVLRQTIEEATKGHLK
jgi:transaldolase/glucose-6-phosphate isomerase